MYKILEVKDTVRVPASKMGMDIEQAIGESVQEKFEGTFSGDLGIVLAVEEVTEVGEGKMIPNDGAVFYPSKFKLMTYVPEEHETTLGEVVDVTEYGAFVRIGPMDAMTHISQVMNDYVSFDKKNLVLSGRDSRRILKVGDVVKAKIISIATRRDNKIGLTMRQDGLGALHWYDKELEKELKEAEKLKEEKAQIEESETEEEIETKPGAENAEIEENTSLGVTNENNHSDEKPREVEVPDKAPAEEEPEESETEEEKGEE